MKRQTIAILSMVAALGCGASSSPAPTATPAEPTAAAATAAPAPSPAPAALEPDLARVAVEGALMAPMPTAVTSFGAASDGKHVYTLGGYHGEPHDYAREGQSDELWRVPIDGGAWEKVGTIEGGGLQGLALVAHGGKLCRLGGNRVLNADGEPTNMRSVAEAACFDPATGAWQNLPPLPEGRSSHDATVAGDRIVVAGGWRLEGKAATGVWQKNVAVLDLAAATPSWKTIDAPFERRAVGVAAVGDRIVVVGGLTPERKPSPQVDVLDPVTGAWTRGPDFPADAFGIAARGIGDVVYASARDGVVYRWKLGSAAWEPAATLAFPRFFHQLVATPAGDLVAIGGISGMHTHGRTRHVERIDVDAEGATLAGFTMPYPGRAKNRQGVFLHGDHVYFFGGNSSLGQHDFEAENFLAEGWRLHLPSLAFEKVADYPVRRQTMQTVKVGELGISVGGFGHDGKDAVSHPQAFAFDFAAGTWSPRGGLSRGRTQFGLVENDGKLWIFGGLNYDPNRKGPAAFDHVTETLIAALEPASTPFEPAEVTLPGPRRAFAAEVLDGTYYIVGGMKEGFGLVDDCLTFTFATRRFEPMPCPKQTRLSGKLLALDGKLYLAGGAVRGEKGMQPARSIEVFDPRTKRWSELVEALPMVTTHMHALTYNDRLLFVSTHREEPILQALLVDAERP